MGAEEGPRGDDKRTTRDMVAHSTVPTKPIQHQKGDPLR